MAHIRPPFPGLSLLMSKAISCLPRRMTLPCGCGRSAATTPRSIGHIARLQRVLDNDAAYVTPDDMLAEMHDDNLKMTARMRATRNLCDEHDDRECKLAQ
jgi:hypothetical protein